MADLLLRQQFRAADGAGASAAMQATFGSGVTVVGHGDRLDFQQHSLVDDGISFTRITSSGSAVEARVVDAPDLLVLTIREGALDMAQPDGCETFGPGDIGLIPLDGAAELTWTDVTFDVFSFPRASITQLLGFGTHQLGQLRCARLKVGPAAITTLWHRFAATLTTGVLGEPELYESDVIREQAIDALLGVTIEAFGISDRAEDDEQSDRALVAKADTWMRSHLADPISIPAVALAAGVSVRGLQLAFRRTGDRTPLIHLRGLRMAAAHEALQAGRPTTVSAVAKRLSYTNLGRFSAHYRAAFGENPADTMRSSRQAETV